MEAANLTARQLADRWNWSEEDRRNVRRLLDRAERRLWSGQGKVRFYQSTTICCCLTLVYEAGNAPGLNQYLTHQRGMQLVIELLNPWRDLPDFLKQTQGIDLGTIGVLPMHFQQHRKAWLFKLMRELR